MIEKFLPVGSVVKIKGSPGKMMITGFLRIKIGMETKKIYDYSGCFYPIGYTGDKNVFCFNHDDIEEIYHVAPADDNTYKVLEGMNSLTDEELDNMINQAENILKNEYFYGREYINENGRNFTNRNTD